MFVALHDLRHARGRFALMLAVIVLVSFLVGFLASLTGGLGRESTSAVTGLPADRLAFSTADGAKPDFTSSSVTAAQLAQWREVPGVTRVEPLGLVTTRASAGGDAVAVTALGVDDSTRLVPGGRHVAPGTVVLSAPARAGLGDADAVTIGSSTLRVAADTGTDDSFAHTPVVWMNLRDWQRLGGVSGDAVASVAAITGDPAGHVADMTALDLSQARSAIASYSSENGSLRTITAFLVVISALVIGAFFSVWTVGRTGDIAVLKALGASSGYLVRDAIGQAAVVLLVGVTAGTALAAAAAALAPAALPVALAPLTLLGPAILLVLAGLLGAAAAVWRITRIDPHAALAAR